MSRYVFNVLAYSRPALRWPTSLAIQYHVHNSAGIKVVNVPALQIVQNYAHANNSGNQAHYQAVYQQAAQHFLQHNALPGNAPMHLFVGDDGVVPRAYDFDIDAIDENDAAADGGDDEDARMPDAEQPVVAIVASHGLDAPAAAADALDVAALPRLAATPTARDAFSAPRLAFIAAAPPLALDARGAAHDCPDAGAFLDLRDCGEQPFTAMASAGPALQALCARCPVVAQAPTSFIRRLAADPDALGRFTEAVASSTTREAAAGRDLACSAFYAHTLYDARHAGDVSNVYDATAGTVLDRSRALSFAGDARTISLLLAAGADVLRSGTHNASGDDTPLHLFAGALDPTSTEADPPDGAAVLFDAEPSRRHGRPPASADTDLSRALRAALAEFDETERWFKPVFAETEAPELPPDGSTDAVDASGAAALATAAPALDPAKKESYETALTELKTIRNNIHRTGHHGGDGYLSNRLSNIAKGLTTPGGDPMNNQSKYMTGRHWVKEPGKKKPKKLCLKDAPFLAALITELESFLGEEPSTVDALDDDDDETEKVVPDTSLEAARRWLDNINRSASKTTVWLKARCGEFGVDYSKLGGDNRAIKRVLVARLEEIVADAKDEEDVDARAKAVMAAIAMGAKGSGLDADDLEFCRVLWTVLCADRSAPVEIVLRGDFLSAALAGLREELPSLELPDAPEEPRASDEATPSPSRDAPPVSEEAASSPTCDEPAAEEAVPSPRPEKAPRASTFVLKREVSDEIWRGLDGKDADALRVASRAGNAVVPDRLALSIAVRRHAAVDEETDPNSRLTMLMDAFVAVDVNAPFPEVLAKVDEIARRLLLEPGLSTVHEGHEGRAIPAGEHMRRIATNVPEAANELAQLCLPKNQRDKWFKNWTNGDVGCTINTQIKAHSVQILLELHVDGILRGETEHDLDEVVSTPSAKQESTLRISLATWRGASKAKRVLYMKGGLTHSTTAGITIIRDASVAIEARLVELTKDYPAEFDKAVKFFLKRFKPEDDAEVSEAAAWRSWLEDSRHVAWVTQRATGEV